MKCPNCNVEIENKCSCGFSTKPNEAVIDTMYVVVQVDEKGHEGIPAIKFRGMGMPMTTSDKKNLDLFKPAIQQLKSTGHQVKVLKFSNREEISL